RPTAGHRRRPAQAGGGGGQGPEAALARGAGPAAALSRRKRAGPAGGGGVASGGNRRTPTLARRALRVPKGPSARASRTPTARRRPKSSPSCRSSSDEEVFAEVVVHPGVPGRQANVPDATGGLGAAFRDAIDGPHLIAAG